MRFGRCFEARDALVGPANSGQPKQLATPSRLSFVSEAVGRIVDRAVQMCGALAISDDLLMSRFYREVRPFRIYDGPSETHRWAIARRAARAARQGANR